MSLRFVPMMAGTLSPEEMRFIITVLVSELKRVSLEVQPTVPRPGLHGACRDTSAHDIAGFMENERQSTEPATAGALWAAGSRSDAMPTPVASGLRTNRFLSLAKGSDDEQVMEPRSTIVDHTCSDAESVPEISNRRRKLRLRWNSDIVQSGQPVVTPVDPTATIRESHTRCSRNEGWTPISDKSEMLRISSVRWCPGWDR